MTPAEAAALVEGDEVEHRGYPGLRMWVQARPPGVREPDYIRPGPPVLVSFVVVELAASETAAAKGARAGLSLVRPPRIGTLYLSGAYLTRCAPIAGTLP